MPDFNGILLSPTQPSPPGGFIIFISGPFVHTPNDFPAIFIRLVASCPGGA